MKRALPFILLFLAGCLVLGGGIAFSSVECPYCHNYTDGKGPHGLQQERRIPRIYLVAGWLLLIAFLLPTVLALWWWIKGL